MGWDGDVNYDRMNALLQNTKATVETAKEKRCILVFDNSFSDVCLQKKVVQKLKKKMQEKKWNEEMEWKRKAGLRKCQRSFCHN